MSLKFNVYLVHTFTWYQGILVAWIPCLGIFQGKANQRGGTNPFFPVNFQWQTSIRRHGGEVWTQHGEWTQVGLRFGFDFLRF
jgi:hypothetical protein